MAEKKYQIYLLICLITNMGYVGQTCRDVRIRCRRANYHFGTKIRQALDDYGPDNFVCIILEEGLSKKEADEREQYWISFLHTTEYGYNTSSGGASGASGVHRSDEVKKRMSIGHLNHPAYSKSVQQFTEEGLLKAEYPSIAEASRRTGIHESNISECCKGRYKTAGGSVWRYAS